MYINILFFILLGLYNLSDGKKKKADHPSILLLEE